MIIKKEPVRTVGVEILGLQACAEAGLLASELGFELLLLRAIDRDGHKANFGLPCNKEGRKEGKEQKRLRKDKKPKRNIIRTPVKKKNSKYITK